MDLEMPGMDGVEATRLIQERYPTPVVALTAYETEALVARAAAVGVGAYLVKPPDARELDRAIRIAIARFEDLMELRRLNAELEAALAQVKTLSGLLPICASCKKIRDDRGYWQRVEVYIRDHSDADFTHGICPDCAMQLYPQVYEEDV
jgi:YesN/AraC family two-component response regulator